MKLRLQNVNGSRVLEVKQITHKKHKLLFCEEFYCVFCSDMFLKLGKWLYLDIMKGNKYLLDWVVDCFEDRAKH